MMNTKELYQSQVASLLEGKENVTQNLGTERFLYLIIVISIGFLLCSLIMTLIMILHRKVQNKRSFKNQTIRNRFQDFLSSFLLLPIDEAFIGIQQNQTLDSGLEEKDIKSKKRRMMLAEEMYSLQKNLNGQQKIQLANYFLGLGLQNEIRKLMSSRKWTNQVKGIQMIKEFELRMFSRQINECAYSNNLDLSIEAIVAKIHLEKDLSIIKSFGRNLTDWEMHKIYCESINNEKLVIDLRNMAAKEKSVVEPMLKFLPKSESQELVFS